MFLLELKEILLIKRDKKMFEWEYYIGTIAPVQQALVIRSLLEFYLILIVATLFLLNGLSIILSCLGV